MDSRYKNPDGDPRGDWKPADFSVKTYSAENDYPITTPSGRVVNPPNGRSWSTSPSNFDEMKKDTSNKIVANFLKGKATDEELVEWLKKQVAKIPQNQRTCRFRAVSCLVLSPEEIYTAEHSIEGCLTDGIRTDYQPGLPYRSMFLEKNSGKFLMDLSQEEYENVNHRQKNIMAIIKYL